MLNDPFMCLLHRCTLSRSACEKRRKIDTETAWSKGLSIACDMCRNPEVIPQKQPSRARTALVKCHYCGAQHPKGEMAPVWGYSCKYRCRNGCDPEEVRKRYQGKNPTLICCKCHHKFPREDMLPYGNGNSKICRACDAQIKKRARGHNPAGATEWKCRTCEKVKKRDEYYRYDPLECKQCKSQRANNRNKEKRKNKAISSGDYGNNKNNS